MQTRGHQVGVWGLLISLVLLTLSPSAARAAAIDDIARDYAELALGALLLNDPAVEVDAKLAPQLAAARSARRDAARIGADAQRLMARLDALAKPHDALADVRRRSLRARLSALELNMRPVNPALPIEEEVQRRFGFTPRFRPLADYDAVLQRLEAAMPGEGALTDRIERMRRAAATPPDRIEPVFRAAMAECRRRTAARMPLADESVEVQFVDEATTPASAQYLGSGRSVIRISRTIPTDVDRLLQHACHEVYPGHHVHYMAMDRQLYRARGWPEFGVGIDSDPLVPVAEAVAEYGVGLAFPVEERIAFERDVLFPLAGLSMTDEAQWRAYHRARSDLLGASATIARDVLTGALDNEGAEQALIRYRLQTPQAAEHTVRMIRGFGSYLIASDFGWYAVDRTMRGRDAAEQWRLLQRLQREPMLLDDIARLGLLSDRGNVQAIEH